MTENLFAFVLMPFDAAFTDTYRYGIKESATALGFRAERVDEQIFQEGMLSRIYRQIELADVVIADMTGKNPNVFYEVGYAHAKEKLCVLLTRQASDIPFDLKHHRHIVYNGSIAELRPQLEKELAWVKNDLLTRQKIKVKVALKEAFGDLDSDEFFATGAVEVAIDLINDSPDSSDEIEAIYFYTGPGWALKQTGQKCSSTASDLSDFSQRHFLNSPIRRLQKNSGWAQIKFSMQKTLGSVFQGDVLRRSYRINGRAVLRLSFTEGFRDYPIHLDVTCDDLPF
jgi:nucleoside 2-deoxyribosyltransferase